MNLASKHIESTELGMFSCQRRQHRHSTGLRRLLGREGEFYIKCGAQTFFTLRPYVPVVLEDNLTANEEAETDSHTGFFAR